MKFPTATHSRRMLFTSGLCDVVLHWQNNQILSTPRSDSCRQSKYTLCDPCHGVTNTTNLLKYSKKLISDVRKGAPAKIGWNHTLLLALRTDAVM